MFDFSFAARWLRWHGGKDHIHPLFQLPAVTIFNLVGDVLHIVDLGYSHHVVGNVLFQLCFMPQYLPQATTPKARLDNLMKRVVRQLGKT